MINEEKVITISRDEYRNAVANAVTKQNKETEKKLDGMGSLIASLMGMKFAATLEEILFDKEEETKDKEMTLGEDGEWIK